MNKCIIYHILGIGRKKSTNINISIAADYNPNYQLVKINLNK